MKSATMLPFMCAVVLSHCTHVQPRELPSRVLIDAKWRGLGEPIDEHLDLVRTDNGYKQGSQFVDASVIRNLLDAMSAPPIQRDEALRGLASTRWLADTSKDSYRVLTDAQGACSPAARDLFERTYTNPQESIAALRSHYDSRHTDDFPSLVVDMRFEDGTSLVATTHSQHAMMLPWSVDRQTTWNPQISRSLGYILPNTWKQRERLSDESLATQLALEVSKRIRERWEELEEKCLYADVETSLKGRVSIQQVYHAWPGQFAAYVHVAGSPSNLVIDVHMSADKKDAVETFFKVIGGYVDTVRPFVAAHPKTVFELWYHDGESVTDDSLQLQEALRPDDKNIKRVLASRHAAVLLRDRGDPTGQRQWVVLPTGDVVEWAG
jgi:hypothetical protein